MTIDETNFPDTMEKKTERTVWSKESDQAMVETEVTTATGINALGTRVALQSIDVGDVWDLKRWRTWKDTYETITAQDVVNVVNKLEDPIKTEISDFIKKGDIKWMQEYLNKKIDDGEIDKDELGNFLRWKGIRFDGHIDVDWKFGPQTLYTMKFIVKKQLIDSDSSTDNTDNDVVDNDNTDNDVVDNDNTDDDVVDNDNNNSNDNSSNNDNSSSNINENHFYFWPWFGMPNIPGNWEESKNPDDSENTENPEESENPEATEEVQNLDWIKEEMGGVIDGFRSGRTEWNWREERHDTNWTDMFDVNAETHLVSLTTRGHQIEKGVETKVPNNKCELDWETGKIYVMCGKNRYEMTVTTEKLELDKNWYPIHNTENEKKIRAFAEVWNLMNMLKANYVFNWGEYSFEESWWDIEYNNNGRDLIHFWNDTEIVSSDVFDKLSNKYAGTWIRFEKAERRDMACLLNAMKLDQGKLTEDELEDGCSDDDVELSKKLSHIYGGK